MLLALGLCVIAQGNQQHQRGWAQWEGLFSSQDGIQQLFAQDFSPPDEFFMRDSDLVWVVLYCSPSARPCGSRDGSGVPDTYRQLASMLRDDRRVRFGLVNLDSPPQKLAAESVGASTPATIQIFHYRPEHYRAGVKAPIHSAHSSAQSLYHEIVKQADLKQVTGDNSPAAWQILAMVASTLLLARLIYMHAGIASAQESIDNATAADVLEEQRRRRIEILEQRCRPVSVRGSDR